MPPGNRDVLISTRESSRASSSSEQAAAECDEEISLSIIIEQAIDRVRNTSSRGVDHDGCKTAWAKLGEGKGFLGSLYKVTWADGKSLAPTEYGLIILYQSGSPMQQHAYRSLPTQ